MHHLAFPSDAWTSSDTTKFSRSGRGRNPQMCGKSSEVYVNVDQEQDPGTRKQELGVSTRMLVDDDAH